MIFILCYNRDKLFLKKSDTPPVSGEIVKYYSEGITNYLIYKGII